MTTPTPCQIPAAATTRRWNSHPAVRFIADYLEMTVSMLVGMSLLGLLWNTGWPGLTTRPGMAAAVMAVDMTLGMALWMGVRRRSFGHILEMSVVMLLPFAVLLGPYLLGVLSGDALLTGGHLGMFGLMAGYLAWRPHRHGAGPAFRHATPPARPRPALTATFLLTAGVALAVVGGILHPHHELPNSHEAVFREYARSTDWGWVHDLQFLSAAVMVAGFLLLSQALRRIGGPSAVVRLGEAASAATVALIAANMAVDGVALKRAVNAWIEAPPADRTARFAAAEAVRWVEWGLNSFFTMLLGVTVLLFATAMLRTAAASLLVRAGGAAGILAGVVLLVNGLGVGAHGFEPTVLPLVATALYLAMAVGIAPLDRIVPAESARPTGPHETWADGVTPLGASLRTSRDVEFLSQPGRCVTNCVTTEALIGGSQWMLVDTR